MKQKTLSICIPTYNRKNVLIKDIRNYLSLSDNRFYIKINDNASNDGTEEEINRIIDERLIYKRNNNNQGPLLNAIKALSNAPSKYVIFIIDKDCIDINWLSSFINYLENQKPNYGYIDLSNNKPESIIKYKAGINAIKNTAYKSKHASGFFARTDLLQSELDKEDYQRLDPTFGFLFDIIAGTLGAKRDADLVYMPLIINANLRSKDNTNQGKSYSYNETNFYFGKKMRIVEYECYMNNLLNSCISLNDKKALTYDLINVFTYNLTLGIRNIYKNPSICNHYNLTHRIIGFSEMIKNIAELNEISYKLCKEYFSIITIIYQLTKVNLKFIIKILFTLIKELIKPYTPIQVSAQ